MLAEILHLCRNAPGALRLKRELPQDELYAELIARADRAGLAERRRALVADLRGRVVEIGCGTGAMFPHYMEADVIGIEPDKAFAAKARAVATPRIEVRDGIGEAIPIEDGAMDAAVLALVLCSVPDEEVICREVARVVKPGGAVRLIEHVRSDHRVAGALMRAVDPLWCWLNGQGCHLDRDPVPALERAGLQIESIKSFKSGARVCPRFRCVRSTRGGPVSGQFAHPASRRTSPQRRNWAGANLDVTSWRSVHNCRERDSTCCCMARMTAALC